MGADNTSLASCSRRIALLLQLLLETPERNRKAHCRTWRVYLQRVCGSVRRHNRSRSEQKGVGQEGRATRRCVLFGQPRFGYAQKTPCCSRASIGGCRSGSANDRAGSAAKGRELGRHWRSAWCVAPGSLATLWRSRLGVEDEQIAWWTPRCWMERPAAIGPFRAIGGRPRAVAMDSPCGRDGRPRVIR